MAQKKRKKRRKPFDVTLAPFVELFLPILERTGVSHARALRLKHEHPRWSHTQIGAQLGISRLASRMKTHRGRVMVSNMMQHLPASVRRNVRRNMAGNQPSKKK